MRDGNGRAVVAEGESDVRRDGHRSGALRVSAMLSTGGSVLAIARRGVLIAVGGSAVLADASGRLLGRAGAAGEKQLTAWSASVARLRERLFRRPERKA